ncbi:hypothetical protein HYH03_003742 [Edaphochlamys debaryana]|uniref:Tr-type G domain-containing protein n=1 Tax=Edaphochlamys debaryana TaxID=47281 RepID=A0A836C376_9CHLO|nr:hypothetical protein HYH03_003742 [Edaphochlamys debaryana]|eukprot:KAG2498490.1 hypothetical protein HYH03_003742 [Edaphochlamys debaryana]
MVRRGQMYDDDDLDDGYDDDYDEYDEAPPPPRQTKAAAPAGRGQQPAGRGGKAAAAPAPAPARAAAKPDPAAKALQKPTYPVAPHLAPGAGAVVAGAAAAGGAAAGGGGSGASPFQFDTPSPDDAIKAAQERRPGVAPPAHAAPAAPSIPQNRAMLKPSPLLQQQRQQGPPGSGPGLAAGTPGEEAEAMGRMSSLSLSEESTPHGTRNHHLHGAGSASYEAPNALSLPGGLHGLHTRRPVTEYSMEPDLAREVDAAAAVEASSSASSAAAPASASAPRPSLHLVVLGHVDAGKSSLMGRLLHELGLVSAKDAHRFQRDAAAAGKGSFAWAWVLDERPEERERGVTVDVAMTRFNTPRFAVTLLDAPGHRDFVPNMIAGAAQADAAILLVDGSPGGFEAGFSEGSGGLHGTPGGQTREHAALARSLGIEQLAVVVSKLDTCGYSKERFEDIRTALLPYLKTVGFRESAITWLPASGPLGENLVGPPQDPALRAWWAAGPCVVEAIDGFAPRERATSRPLRMPISDVFKSKTGAVVLGGKVEGGALRPGSKVVLVPGPVTPFVVRSLEVGGQAAQLARAGDSCEVALVGSHHGAGGGGGGAIDPSSVAPGAVLCHPDFPACIVTRFELRIVVLDVPVPLLKGTPVTLHAHVAREEGHITALTATLDPRTGEVVKARPRCLTKGQSALVEVTAARGLVLEEYSQYRALGRVALRDGGRTVAVGVVTQLLA